MDKRKGYFAPGNLIITNRDRAYRSRRVFCHILSFPFWIFFAYAITPLFVSLLQPTSEGFLFNFFSQSMLAPAIETIRFCLFLILFLLAVYCSWSYYNKRRYGGKFNKRVHPTPYLDTRELARQFHVAENSLGNWQKGKIRVLTFDDRENVVAITGKSLLSLSDAAAILTLPLDKIEQRTLLVQQRALDPGQGN